MLKIQKDESIHSLIYRTHMLNGISNFTNLVGSTGCWTSFPKILQGTLCYYKPIDEPLILSLMQQVGLAMKPQSMFDNPMGYIDEFFDFFRLATYPKSRSFRNKKIKYCLNCIQDSIKQIGFGYFNVNWYYGDFCSKHNRPLLYIKATNQKSAINLLHLVYLGRNPKDYGECMRQTDYDYIYHNEKTQVDFIAPCLASVVA